MFKRIIEKSFVNFYFAAVVFSLTALLFYFFFKDVDLTPQVNSNFFFSQKSKIYKDDQKIYKMFLVEDSIILSLPAKDITDESYLHLISKLSDEIKQIKGVNSVLSMTHGPPNIESAITNPLWIRFLDTKYQKSSLIVCFIKPDKVQSVVAKVQNILYKKDYRKQRVYISGVPYIVEEIRRMLTRDMKKFIAVTIAVSTVVLLFIFMSFVVAVGAIFTSLSAAALTLLVQHFLGIPVGILTANLGAIVYVLTVSHIVFLTTNWRQDTYENKNRRISSTIVTTFPASFWSMLTTVFGFCSLIFVEAKPLQQLGISGTIGTLAAFVMAYILYPIFLRFSKTGKKKDQNKKPKFPVPFHLAFGLPLALLLIAGSAYVGWLGYKSINFDPSLLTYFKESQPVYQGILSVDQHGGCNPINFVVSDPKGEKLTSSSAYKRMMALQKDLETHPSVGSVLSLPILMDATQETWIARILPWGSVLSILSKDQFNKVASGFITKDQKQGLYMIRMKETVRKSERDKIVQNLMAKTRKHDLRLDIVGGSYYMQSELSQKIKSSLKTGIQALGILFATIIFLLSLSFFTTFYATLSITALAVTYIGTIGYFKIPVDIISSPSINIVLGMAVDGMIHIILAARRLSLSKGHRTDKDGWVDAIKSQGSAVLTSGLVICSGFSVFYLSDFPPSQRFGVEIVFGAFLSVIVTLLILPHLTVLFRRKTPSE